MPDDDQNRPIIVQSDKSVLIEVDNPAYERARDILARFAELEKSPEYIHTYRITNLSLWNAAAAGLTAEMVIDGLQRYSKYPPPSNIIVDIHEYMGRYGRVKLVKRAAGLCLISDDIPTLEELRHRRELKPYILARLDPHTLLVDTARRGHVKQALVKIGYPAEDLAGYMPGAPLEIHLLPVAHSGQPFSLRHYQQEAVDIFYANGSAAGGSGVIVLPCGAGKTMVGMGAIETLQTNTLILAPSTVAVRQWIDELLDKTSLTADIIGEYTGEIKQIRPITVSTYQILTYRKRKRRRKGVVEIEGPEFPHFELFNKGDWGLIIYDEVHLLPAPVFRVTAELQARRRLGLTATLVREDGREEDVFSLIGPKKYDVPWKELEKQGWIATADCCEIRVEMDEERRLEYAMTTQPQRKYRYAAENPRKLPIVDELLVKHRHDRVLIIGMYLDQLRVVADRYHYPLITGKTPVRERRKLFGKFRSGEITTLILSKVGNFAIDLPDANVAIQISGTFGSRQEEAQRLGRILRPKEDGSLAHFYTIVSRDTVDQLYAANRQLFLTEQGYRYTILYEEETRDFQPDRNTHLAETDALPRSDGIIAPNNGNGRHDN